MAPDTSLTREDLFRLLVAAVEDYAIFALDPQGRVRSWNLGAQRIMGYDAEEVVGRHVALFHTPEAVAEDRPKRELRVALGEGRYEEEGWRVRKDGSRFWANVVITPLRDEEGAHLGFAKITRDLTERRAAQLQALDDARALAAEEAARKAAEVRAEELGDLLDRVERQALELEQRRAEAEEANRVKSEFLARMSHDLRTPLNAIGGYVDLILGGVRGPVRDQMRADLERVRRSQRHLLVLINDLLNFARLEAGRVRYQMEPVRLADAVGSVLEMVEPQAAAAEISLRSDDVPSSLRAMADRDKLEQILLNLLSNSLKHTPAGGTVEMRAESRGEHALLHVSDTGPGVAPEELERVFDPFTQAAGDTMEEGVGLGLAISRDLARGMGGELSVESPPGEGATFTVRLRAEGDAGRG